MKIEVTEHSVSEDALHRGVHDEAWVRVLHDDPQLNVKVALSSLTEEQGKILGPYGTDPCGAYSGLQLDDDSGDDEMEGYMFEDWYVFPRRKSA